MTTNKEAARARAALLKRLREEHKETFEHAQALLKEQKAIRRRICRTIRDAPKTVPEVAQASGLPANEVLWHIIAMKKYEQVTETDMCGEYYLYQMVKESKK